MTKRRRSFVAIAVAAVACALSVCGPASEVRADEQSSIALAGRATDQILAGEYDKARAELAKGDPQSPSVVLAKARLALYEEDCDLAAALLRRGIKDEGKDNDDARLVADVSRGCARVTASTVVEKDDANGVVVRFHDEADRALAPLVIETVIKARASLTRDLGVEWKKPMRITVVRDLLSLSAMTGLPYKAAQTTGTVAVAKWGRVTILSPRASQHGYAWRDTLAHELTHLAISLQTRERAPLWLHEGVARREEVRWREPGLFDEKPTPESIVMRGIEMKLDLALDKLGPSIAMLPSADQAMVAFAEVTSFVKYFVESKGDAALPKLLVSLRAAKSVDDALKEVSGETLAQWDVKWRAMLQKRPKETLSPLFGLGGPLPSFTDARERSRLAELLVGRGHTTEASLELDKIPAETFADPSLRYLRARVHEANGKEKDATELVDDPKPWLASYGPCWAIRGRLERARGDAAGADRSFVEAVAHDPLAVESACETKPGDASGQGSKSTPLCEAARQRNEPDIGRD